MKKIWLLALISAFTISACQRKSEEEKLNTSILENINKGVFPVYAEKNTAYLMEQIIQIYTSRFPEAVIDIRYADEWEVIDKMTDDSARIIVLQRELNAEELKYIETAFSTKPIQGTFAYDAIALVQHRGHPYKVVKYSDIQKWIKTGEERFVTLPEHIDIYKLLIRMLGEDDTDPKIALVTSIDELKAYLAANPDKYGLLPFHLVSDQDDSKAKEIASKFSWLGLEINESNITDTVYPSQSTIFTKEWPLRKTFTFVSCKIGRHQGFGFINFAHSIPIKKLIVKAGLVPYRMPERAIVLEEGDI